MDSYEYLENDFNPKSLKVAELRRIFLFHDIAFPSSAKKTELVDIFLSEIAPRAESLRSSIARVIPQGNDILDVPRRITRSTSPAKSPSKDAPTSPRKSPSKRGANSVRKVTPISLDNPATQFPAPVHSTSSSDFEAIPLSPRRRGRNLAKPFVDPDTKEVPQSPKKESGDGLRAVKNPSTSSTRKGNSSKQEVKTELKTEFEFSEFLKEEVVENLKVEVKDEIINIPTDNEAEEKDEIDDVVVDIAQSNAEDGDVVVDVISDDSVEAIEHGQASPNAAITTPSKERTPSKSEKSPFTSVNFFQSSSSPSSTPKSQRKRPLEDESEFSTRKKRETVEFEEPQEHSIMATPQTPAVDDSVNYSQFETPEQEAPEPIAPYTAPVQRNQEYVDNNFGSQSASKPIRNSLRGAGAGRRISFMPKVEQLNMSEEFSRQLGSSSPSHTETPKIISDLATSSPAVEMSPVEAEEVIVEEIKELQEEMKELQEEMEGEQVEDDVTNIPVKSRSWMPFVQAFGLSLVVIALSSFARWWVLEKFEAGYCEVSRHTQKPYYGHYTPETFSEYFDKEFILDRANLMLEYVRPECVPCPAHAVCYPEFKAECEPGFVKLVSPFSLGGVLPMAPQCKPDTQKQKRVQMLTEKTLQILRERNAKVECGTLDLEDAGVEENELRDILYSMKTASLSDDEFNDLWNSAINDIESEEEIIVRQVHHVDEHSEETAGDSSTIDNEDTPSSSTRATTTTKIIRSTSLAGISVSCAIRRSVVGSLGRYRVHLGVLLSVIAGYFAYKHWKAAHDKRRAHAEKLAAAAIARLKKQRVLAQEDERGLTMRCVAVPQLRDEIQADVTSLETRKRVWADVERLVETNSNIRARQADIYGEIMRVWEWVGVI